MFRFRLPDIGEGLSEAELLEWSVAIGDSVAEGQELAVISTDKVNVDLPSPVAGVIRELCCQVGDVVPVGQVIVVIDDGRHEGERSSTETAGKPASPNANQPHQRAAVPTANTAGHRAKAAPVTRRLAAELDVAIEHVSGTGPDGQILNRDVEAFAAGQQGAHPPSPTPGQAHRSAPDHRLKLTGARLTAARRLAESSRRMAATCMNFEVRGDAILDLCSDGRAAAQTRAVKLTPLAAVAHGLALALASHPHFNAVIAEADNELLMYDNVNLGIAVDTDQGLVVPVLRGVQGLGLLDLAQAIAETAARARAGDLSLHDMQGATFTLSSTGGLEKANLLSTAPVINMPNVATLWVSRIRTRPRVSNDVVEAGPIMYGSLAFDHRYLHGADGVAFLNELTGLLEKPD